jgi:phosphate transport system substrate-binding protein
LRTTLSRSRLLVAIVGLATVLAACGSSSKPNSSGGSATVNGAGSSFQKAFDEAIIAKFQDANSKITVTYNPVGSGSGKSLLQTKNVDFAGTDSLPKAADLGKYQGGALLYFPTVAAPITISYHLGSVSKLRLSGTTLAKIFSLKVKKWDDPAIAADNPGVSLPSTAITVARREDGSGTTTNFTKFLDQVDPTDWTLGSGDTVEWASLPGTTRGGTKNGGVAQIVKQTDGAIGYVDLADATAAKLQIASVQNKSGSFVEPTVTSAAAAVANAKLNADLSYDPVNASGADAYPITSPTWIIAYEKQTSNAVGTALKTFLQFIYADGETLAPTVGYAALPSSFVQKATAQLSKLQIPA